MAPGEIGVLHVRGPHVMMGYWNLPDETAHMLKPGPYPGERMLCTHDYFKTDEDGFLYFVGRSDDMIKSRGEKVSPVEVENALSGIPGVREAAVVGVPDELMGQAVRAFVVLEEGADLDERAFRRHCHGEAGELYGAERRRVRGRSSQDGLRQGPQDGISSKGSREGRRAASRDTETLNPSRNERGRASMSETERDVRQFVADNFILDRGADDLPGDESLTQSGVLDSMGVLELIMFIEERFGVKVPDEDTLPANLDTVDNIVRYVQGRLAGVSAADA